MAQLLATPVFFYGARLLCNQTALYAIAYTVATVAIVLATWYWLWPRRPHWSDLWSMSVFGICMGIIALIDLGQLNAGVLVTFIEGVVLVITSLALLRLKDSLFAVAVGTLDLALASFDFGYILNPALASANNWVPSWLCTAAFGYIVLKSNRKEILA